jgi:uncharacterized protein
MVTTQVPVPDRAAVPDRTPERELLGFLLTTFLVSWGLGLGATILIAPDAYVLGVFGPAVAALWATRRYEGSFASLWTQILRWRLRLRWYVAAVFGPLLLMLVSWGIYTLPGRVWEVEDPLAPALAPVFFLAAFLVAGGPEELGWRGYALPRLQSRWNALVASLILGAVWALWHAPLWFIPGLFFGDLSFPLYAVETVAMAVVFTWIYNSSGGSVLLAMLMHASVNLAAAYMPMEVGPQGISAVVWSAGALLVMFRYGPTDLSRRTRVDRKTVRVATVAPRRELEPA